ncbi:MAG TPA: hypothetical protein VG711_07510, partial [Phycisphaerales bacterium]|nr:hypothetical protein [Phycisphaerales bacterium]
LFQYDNPRITQWAISLLGDLPADQSAPVYEYLIDAMNPPDNAKPLRSEADQIALAVSSVSKLYESHPDAVLNRLKSAKPESKMQQCILLGLLDVKSDDVAEAGAMIARSKPTRSACLACLLLAKHRATLSEQDRALLGTMASGGGMVSEVLQVQAAWLYLKHTNQVNVLLQSMNQSLGSPTTP